MSCYSTNFLDSHQKELCLLISKHTQADEILENIIQKLGENVSNPFYRKFCNQRGPIEKIDILFKMVIEKGEQTCREFIQILEKIVELQQFWSKNKQESSRQTVYADNNSFVDNRRIAGGKAKCLTMRYQHEANSQHDTGDISPNRDIVAINSIIDVKKIENIEVDENMDFSMSNLRESRGSSVDKEMGCVASSSGSSEKGCVASTSVNDKLGFFRNNLDDLVSKVKNVLPIVDYLQTKGYHSEMAANVKAEKTKEQQMRVLLDSTTSTGAAEDLFTALCKHEPDIMKDYGHGSYVAMEKDCIASSSGSYVAMEKDCIASSSVDDKLDYWKNFVSKVKNVPQINNFQQTNNLQTSNLLCTNMKAKKTKQQCKGAVTKGTGASKSLKLNKAAKAAEVKTKKPAKKAAASKTMKPAAAKKPKKVVAKKPAAAKKSAKKIPAASKKAAKIPKKAAKIPKKVKKSAPKKEAKPKAAKPKSAKPKKAAPKKK